MLTKGSKMARAQGIQKQVRSGAYRIVDGQVVKRCWNCGEWKPYTLDFYYRRRSNVSGLTNECRTCSGARARNYRRARYGHVPAELLPS